MSHLPNQQTYPGIIPPPAGVIPDVSFSPSKWNIITHSLCVSLTTIFMILRFYTKFFILKKIDLDDYAAVAAWIGFTAWASIALAEGPLGIGIHLWNIPPSTALKFFQTGYVMQVLYSPVVFATKLAILLLFLRIFSIKRGFVLFARIFIAAISLGYIAITLVTIFICHPIEKFWNPLLPGSCMNSNTIFISACVVAIITDCIILCAPCSIIWKLQMSFWSKVGSTVALIAGGLACVASILRLVFALRTMHDVDKSYIFLPILLWASCEIAIGIICSCLPVLPSLFRRLAKRKSTSYGSQTKRFEGERWKANRMTDTVSLQALPSYELRYPAGSISSSQRNLRY